MIVSKKIAAFLRPKTDHLGFWSQASKFLTQTVCSKTATTGWHPRCPVLRPLHPPSSTCPHSRPKALERTSATHAHRSRTASQTLMTFHHHAQEPALRREKQSSRKKTHMITKTPSRTHIPLQATRQPRRDGSKRCVAPFSLCLHMYKTPPHGFSYSFARISY